MRISDWSSDVCSSDLQLGGYQRRPRDRAQGDRLDAQAARAGRLPAHQRQDVGRTLSGRAGAAIPDRRTHLRLWPDRKSVVAGKSVSVRLDLGGLRIIQKHKQNSIQTNLDDKNK